MRTKGVIQSSVSHIIKIKENGNINTLVFKITFIYECENGVGMDTRMPSHMCGGQRTM